MPKLPSALFGAQSLLNLYWNQWNFAVKLLGAVKTSIYIYMVPVITIVTSVLILKEPLTILSVIGTLLAIIGLLLSEYNGKRRQNE